MELYGCRLQLLSLRKQTLIEGENPMSREMNKKDKRNRLLCAARKAFAEKGYRKTTVDEIVEKAKVAKGTFYLYFKNKESILNEIISLLEKQYFLLRNDMQKKETVGEKLFTFSKGYFKFLKENKELARIGLFNVDQLDENIKKQFIKLQRLQVDSISTAISLSCRNVKEPRKAALAFVGIVNYFAAHYILNTDEKFSPNENAEYVVDIFLKGIGTFLN
jgi:AcrR family transcriptional regulator